MGEGVLILTLLTILFVLFATLTERKVLAYTMRRLGPTLMRLNDTFRTTLDLFKMPNKKIFLIPQPTSSLAPTSLPPLIS